MCVRVSEVNSGDEDEEIRSADSSYSSQVGSGHVDNKVVRGTGKAKREEGETDRRETGKVEGNTRSPVWAGLHLRRWDGLRDQLLRKTLKNQQEAENMGLLSQSNVRTRPERARRHLQRGDPSQRQTQQTAARRLGSAYCYAWLNRRTGLGRRRPRDPSQHVPQTKTFQAA